MILEKGVVVHPDEVTGFWRDTFLQTDLRLLGIHPVGGAGSHGRVKKLAEEGLPAESRDHLATLKRAGVGIEYELHVMSLLLPRELFARHPEYFRTDEKGGRNPDLNCCASNPDALEIVAENAARLARALPSSTHRYSFWLDDARSGICRCPACASLSAADQALLVYNAVERGIRRADPLGRQSYLAYCGASELPARVTPEDGIYLEYAPFDRDPTLPMTHSGNAPSAKNARELAAFFGAKEGKVLEYWLDNSKYSGWKKPPKKLVPDPDVIRRDLDFYDLLGFRTATTFACFLGEDYEALWGKPDLGGYAVPRQAGD
ncbi:MAG: DUF4838 domain-containing protein [Clostridia bacterium]|nr:DUF4838 domain-containing protein [Clostridia bacterium]